MNAHLRTASTRHALLRVTRRLQRVRAAAELLSRKRSALVNELFQTARPVLDAREAIAAETERAYATLLQAQSEHGQTMLGAFAVPIRELSLTLRATETWGLAGAEITERDPVRRSAAERSIPPGAAGPATTAAAEAFELLTELLLDAASRELRMRRLARAVAETSRRVNLLERRVAPRLASEVSHIESTLEERERDEQMRFRRLLERPRDGTPVAARGRRTRSRGRAPQLRRQVPGEQDGESHPEDREP